MIGPMVMGFKDSELETERYVLLAQGWEMGIKKQVIPSKLSVQVALVMDWQCY